MPERSSTGSAPPLGGAQPSSLPPAPDELEVSLFGPGYGECVVLHIGGGEWVVVDSCVSGPRARSVALDYLQSLGVSPELGVKLIVATHWHDDHIRGLAEVVRLSPNAGFACTAALGKEDFITLAELTRTDLMMESSGIDEFRTILEELSARPQTPMWTLGGKMLYERTASIGANILALTPSDRAFQDSVSEIARLLPSESEPKRRVWPSGPNHGSVVLMVTVGRAVVLLGADLEEASGGHWSALLASPTKPSVKANVFKIPHHGSPGADHPGVWSDLVEADAIAAVAPFDLGHVTLPGAADRTRICGYGRRTFITAAPVRPRSRRRESAVERTIKDVVGELTLANRPLGQVRVRRSLANVGAPWSIQTFGQAYELCA